MRKIYQFEIIGEASISTERQTYKKQYHEIVDFRNQITHEEIFEDLKNMHLEYSEESIVDLDNVIAYIAKDSTSRALQYIEKLKLKIELLICFENWYN